MDPYGDERASGWGSSVLLVVLGLVGAGLIGLIVVAELARAH